LVIELAQHRFSTRAHVRRITRLPPRGLRIDLDALMRHGAISKPPGKSDGKMPRRRRRQASQSAKDSEMKGKYGL
jgi:hypothetical protein